MSGLKFGASSMAGLAGALQNFQQRREREHDRNQQFRHLELLEQVRQKGRIEEALAQASEREKRYRSELGERAKNSVLQQILKQHTLDLLAKGKGAQWQGQWFSQEKEGPRPEGFQGPPLGEPHLEPAQEPGLFRKELGEEWADLAEDDLELGMDPLKVRQELEKAIREKWKQKQRLVPPEEKGSGSMEKQMLPLALPESPDPLPPALPILPQTPKRRRGRSPRPKPIQGGSP